MFNAVSSKLIVPFNTVNQHSIISLHEHPLYCDDDIDISSDIPQRDDYFDDVHISLDSVIDAGKNWLVINKPSCLSLDDSPRANNKFSVKQRLLSFLKRPQNEFIVNQIGLDSFWWKSPQILFPYPLDKGVSGSLMIAFSKDVDAFVKEQHKNEQILETMLAAVYYKNAFGLKTFSFKSNEIWANFAAELTFKKSNFSDIEGQPANDRMDVFCKWRCVATDNDEDGFALLQFEYSKKVNHEVRRLCVLNRTPIVGEDRYIDTKAVDIQRGIGHCSDMMYQPFVTKSGRNRLGLHIGRLKLVTPNPDNIELHQHKQERHKNILDPTGDKLRRKSYKSPLPKEFKNVFSKGLKSRAPRFAVDL